MSVSRHHIDIMGGTPADLRAAFRRAWAKRGKGPVARQLARKSFMRLCQRGLDRRPRQGSRWLRWEQGGTPQTPPRIVFPPAAFTFRPTDADTLPRP